MRTTAEIVETLRAKKDQRANHAIPIAEPLELPEKNLIIDPYIFGVWLGDGTSAYGHITSMDSEIINYEDGIKVWSNPNIEIELSEENVLVALKNKAIKNGFTLASFNNNLLKPMIPFNGVLIS